MEFQTLAEFLAQLYPKEAEIFRYRGGSANREPPFLFYGQRFVKFVNGI